MCCFQAVINVFVHLILRVMTAIFFKQVGSFNTHSIPEKGPVIFVCAPHANQFIDPMIVQQCCSRKVGFLAAQKSVDRKIVGKFIKAMDGIGVQRSQDCRRPLHGTVVSTDLHRIWGTDTMFLRDFGDNEQLYISSLRKAFRVAEVVSNTELTLKDGLDAVLLDPSAYKSEPKLDQTAVFDKVFDVLHNGECIGIFPEGGSHDRASMLPLKAGVTIMALGAMAKYPGLKVALVPVGLNYFHAHRFRSQVYADFGSPFYVEPRLVDMYTNKQTKRKACSELLELIHERLSIVTVNTKDHLTKSTLIMARRLYKPESRELAVPQRLELNRRFALAIERFGDDPRMKNMIDEVTSYRELLKAHSVRDYQVENMSASSLRSGAMLIWRTLQVLVMFPLGLPGALLYAPVAYMANNISKQKAVAAVAGSNVKVKGNDVMATWKVMVAAVVIPLVTLVYALIAAVAVVFLFNEVDLWIKLLVPLASLLVFPCLGYVGIRTWETGIPHLLSLRPLLWATCLCCGGYEVVTLKMARDHLQGTILKLVETFGPEMYGSREAFENNRIIQHADFQHKFSIIQVGNSGEALLDDIKTASGVYDDVAAAADDGDNSSDFEMEDAARPI